MDAISYEWLLSATAFAVSMSATPGPNNAMVASSGATFGVARTMPHVLGISVGFPLMLVAVALGADGVLRRFPELHMVLKWVGAAYLLWLAWHIATAHPDAAEGGGRRARPLNFLEAALFQWVNPKAWVIALGAVATYTSADAVLLEVLLLAAIFLVVCVPSTALWTGIGAGAARLLRSPRALRRFNVAMALLLVASLLPLLAE
jgi:threonine/homoserine/homoserine lactone efflux protein